MPITANFLVSPTFLSVAFTDISTGYTGSITSWVWDFGDNNTASTQNPTNVYSIPGTYNVTLSITDSAGNTSNLSRSIIVDLVPILPVPIKQFVLIKVPPPLVIPPGAIDAYIAQYQLYIQPLVNSPGVAYADTFNEAAYPPLVNALIAMAAAYAIILDYGAKNLMLGSTASTSGSPGLLKKITTGPSEAEWQDIASIHKSVYGPAGLLTELQKELCDLAGRLMIRMKMCPPLPTEVFIQQKAGRDNNIPNLVNVWNLYPYNIPIII